MMTLDELKGYLATFEELLKANDCGVVLTEKTLENAKEIVEELRYTIQQIEEDANEFSERTGITDEELDEMFGLKEKEMEDNEKTLS